MVMPSSFEAQAENDAGTGERPVFGDGRQLSEKLRRDESTASPPRGLRFDVRCVIEREAGEREHERRGERQRATDPVPLAHLLHPLRAAVRALGTLGAPTLAR